MVMVVSSSTVLVGHTGAVSPVKRETDREEGM
jgi:hypothetical protein